MNSSLCSPRPLELIAPYVTVQAALDVPTLGQWGLLALGVLVVSLGHWLLVTRSKRRSKTDEE
jgi:hypothetical protein